MRPSDLDLLCPDGGTKRLAAMLSSAEVPSPVVIAVRCLWGTAEGGVGLVEAVVSGSRLGLDFCL